MNGSTDTLHKGIGKQYLCSNITQDWESILEGKKISVLKKPRSMAIHCFRKRRCVEIKSGNRDDLKDNPAIIGEKHL